MNGQTNPESAPKKAVSGPYDEDHKHPAQPRASNPDESAESFSPTCLTGPQDQRITLAAGPT